MPYRYRVTKVESQTYDAIVESEVELDDDEAQEAAEDEDKWELDANAELMAEPEFYVEVIED